MIQTRAARRQSAADVVSGFNLRGLGSGKHVVLLNGRRIASYGSAQPNSGRNCLLTQTCCPTTFFGWRWVDVSCATANRPLTGSDAVAGVINFVDRPQGRGHRSTVAITKPKSDQAPSWVNAKHGRIYSGACHWTSTLDLSMYRTERYAADAGQGRGWDQQSLVPGA